MKVLLRLVSLFALGWSSRPLVGEGARSSFAATTRRVEKLAETRERVGWEASLVQKLARVSEVAASGRCEEPARFLPVSSQYDLFGLWSNEPLLGSHGEGTRYVRR